MLRFIIYLIILLTLVFNTFTLNKVIEFSLSRWFDKKITIENLDFFNFNNRIIFHSFKVYDEDKKNYDLFDAKKIIIEIDLNTIFKEEIIFPLIVIDKAKFTYELEFDKKGLKDNLGIVQKKINNEPKKIYKIKKKDKNFLIKKVKFVTPVTKVIIPGVKKPINIEYSNMNFVNIGNGKSKDLHYKDLFQYLLKDLYFRIPEKNKIQNIDKILKKLLN
ncbi:MAG: hypothetical protein CBC24_00470 [Candidatus Pelagibacter sp. TMED64]|nr:hypothetical protein [Candidatus Pelagibacter sp.]OUU67706.1 MAG: hypothetical protein CBC24_00470 [Candidatus Pelagibacter sp. TMED64]